MHAVLPSFRCRSFTKPVNTTLEFPIEGNNALSSWLERPEGECRHVFEFPTRAFLLPRLHAVLLPRVPVPGGYGPRGCFRLD